MPLILPPALMNSAAVAMQTNARSKVYSIKSCPRSSLKKRWSKVLMPVPFDAELYHGSQVTGFQDDLGYCRARFTFSSPRRYNIPHAYAAHVPGVHALRPLRYWFCSRSARAVCAEKHPNENCPVRQPGGELIRLTTSNSDCCVAGSRVCHAPRLDSSTHL